MIDAVVCHNADSIARSWFVLARIQSPGFDRLMIDATASKDVAPSLLVEWRLNPNNSSGRQVLFPALKEAAQQQRARELRARAERREAEARAREESKRERAQQRDRQKLERALERQRAQAEKGAKR